MVIEHKLTYNGVTTVIDEPVGFDNLQMSLSRGDYHGIGAEVSAGKLEFYGKAYDIIDEAYDADIDSLVDYDVMADGVTLYSGRVDLSTCSFKFGNYKSVSCNVGEIGAKTTFNNRIGTEVDITTQKTIDGSDVSSPNWLNMHIPPKHLLYTSIPAQKTDKPIRINVEYSAGLYLTEFAFDDSSVNEFGSLNITDENGAFLFIKTEDYDEKYGTGTRIEIDADINLEVRAVSLNYMGNPSNVYVRLQLLRFNTVLAQSSLRRWESDGVTPLVGAALHLEYKGTVDAGTIKTRVIYYTDTGNTGTCYIDFTIKESSVKLKMYDTLPETKPVYADMIHVHDALNVVAHSISENALAVKSEWYRTPNSLWESGTLGNGAPKALTSGYKIRGVSDKPVQLSFKTLMESLSALDCVGWGFSVEDGTLFVRVERWDWFYKDDVVLELTNVQEVKVDVDADHIPTELQIGYKKYASSDEYNSIESPHGTRTFSNGIKAISKTLNKLCDFIADNYAIEDMRRAVSAGSEATAESKYDENIFVFELGLRSGTNPRYEIIPTAQNATNVGRESELINAKISPRHMASRWRDYLFSTNNNSDFRFVSSELNSNSQYAVCPRFYNGYYTLSPFEGQSNVMAENAPLAYTHAKFQGEKITFSYPLTLAQYNTIKANPYGLIGVNGRYGWIMDFKYTFATGMASFTLISKR